MLSTLQEDNAQKIKTGCKLFEEQMQYDNRRRLMKGRQRKSEKQEYQREVEPNAPPD